MEHNILPEWCNKGVLQQHPCSFDIRGMGWVVVFVNFVVYVSCFVGDNFVGVDAVPLHIYLYLGSLRSVWLYTRFVDIFSGAVVTDVR